MGDRRFGHSKPQAATSSSSRPKPPETRDVLAGPVLNELGAWELDARTDADGLEAAAALCRSAGYWAVPYPVAERLARPVDLDTDGLIVVASNRPAGAVGGVETRWTAVTLDGATERSSAAASRVPRSSPRSKSRRRTGRGRRRGTRTRAAVLDIARHARPCVELTIAHVSLRKQFGQPLSTFQGVQFQLTDAEVERSGLEILAKYALWSAGSGRPEAS